MNVLERMMTGRRSPHVTLSFALRFFRLMLDLTLKGRNSKEGKISGTARVRQGAR